MGSRAFCVRSWDSPYFLHSDLDEVFRDERAVFLVIETHFTLLPASPDHVLETLRSSTMMVMMAANHTVRECGHAFGCELKRHLS
jgi:hypothetical protein